MGNVTEMSDIFIKHLAQNHVAFQAQELATKNH